jgi:hypothetical protein
VAYPDLGNPAAFIFHHTGGRSDPVPTLRQRGLGVQFVMDRDGNIKQVGGAGESHMQPGSGAGAGLSNANTVGMEIIARDNRDVTPAQVAAAQKFIAQHYQNIPIYGHGEVNPGHKQPDEGMAIVNAILGARAGQQAPSAAYSPEDPRGLADRKTLSLPELPRAPFAPQPMQMAHAGALAGFPLPQQAPPQAPQGGPLALFSPPAAQQGGAPAAAPMPAQPGAAGQSPGPSIWSMMGMGGGQAPSMPLFAPQQGQGGQADPAMAQWWARQNTMTG